MLHILVDRASLEQLFHQIDSVFPPLITTLPLLHTHL